jgi:methyl-accepting chemotaxis protein
MDKMWKYFLITIFLSLSVSFVKEIVQQAEAPEFESEENLEELVEISLKLEKIEAMMNKFSTLVRMQQEKVLKLNDQVQQFNEISQHSIEFTH